MGSIEFEQDHLVIKGLLKTETISYSDIARAVVRHTGGLAAAQKPGLVIASADDLIIILNTGLEIRVGRQYNVEYEGDTATIDQMAIRITKEANLRRRGSDLPSEVAAQVAQDMLVDDRPWWEQG